MTALLELVWYCSWGDYDQLARSNPNAIFRVLAECKSLTHLVLLGRYGLDMDHDSGDFPVSMSISCMHLLSVGHWAKVLGLSAVDDTKFGDTGHQGGLDQPNRPHLCKYFHHAALVADVAGQP
jgi:hypothetical protein